VGISLASQIAPHDDRAGVFHRCDSAATGGPWPGEKGWFVASVRDRLKDQPNNNFRIWSHLMGFDDQLE
jgi:hypothetical protein